MREVVAYHNPLDLPYPIMLVQPINRPIYIFTVIDESTNQCYPQSINTLVQVVLKIKKKHWILKQLLVTRTLVCLYYMYSKQNTQLKITHCVHTMHILQFLCSLLTAT